MISQPRFWTKGRKLIALGMTFVGAGSVTAYNLATPAFATELHLHPPELPWAHRGFVRAFDHDSIRRGYQVYREVCAACHSMKFLYFRHLVNVCLTESEAKAIAASCDIQDGPDDTGNMFTRPGKLSDHFPQPYPNDNAARAANNGALPPDLSYIVLARHNTEDYIFHLLTGYCDPPAGREMQDGQYYNPYFVGGAIGMAQALWNELIEYDDGTPATISQMAKDVTNFLSWSADQHRDFRQRFILKLVCLTGGLVTCVYLWKKRVYVTLKQNKTIYKNRPPPKI